MTHHAVVDSDRLFVLLGRLGAARRRLDRTNSALLKAAVPSKAFLIAAGVAATGILAGVLFAREPKPVAMAAEPHRFSDRWTFEQSTAVKDQDRDRAYAPLGEPKPVKTVRIMSDPVLSLPVTAKPTPPPPKPIAVRASLREGICAKGKRWYRKGKGWAWRCKR